MIKQHTVNKRNFGLSSMRPGILAAWIAVAVLASGVPLSKTIAGTPDSFKTGSSLTTPGNYNSGMAPGNTTDVTLTTTTTALTIAAGAVTMESLSVTNGTSYTISNSTSTSGNSTLTLGNSAGFTNSTDSVMNDLIDLSGASKLTISGANTGSPAGTGTLGVVLASSGNFANNSSGTGLTISANISGAQTLTLSGTGTSSFTGTNTFSALVITAGELDVSADTSLGAVPTTATADLTINGGRLGSNSNLTFTINQNRTILLGSTVGTSLSVKGTGDVTYNGSFQDFATGGILVKQGGGTLDLGGVSTYTGATSIGNGIIRLNGANLLPAGTTVSIGQSASTNNGELDLNGQNLLIAGLNSVSGTNTTGAKNAAPALNTNILTSSTGSSTLTLGGSGTYAFGDGSFINSGNITGAISINKTGSGTQTFGGNNTYTGSTTVSGGMLIVGTSTTPSAKALGGTSGVFVNNGGTLQMGAANQFNATPATVTLNGTTGTGNAATFSINGNSQGSTMANGVGALTLSAISANNVLDFNSKPGTVTFSSFTSNSAILTINNYTANNGAPDGSNQLIFNQDETNNLNNIVFTGYGAATEQLVSGTAGMSNAFYEVYPTAVPEPATWLGGLLLLGTLGYSQRHRLQGLLRVGKAA